MKPDKLNLSKKAVLVTGCSSGIGRTVSLYLAQQGFTVFASVRRQEDAGSLLKSADRNLIPVCPLDLTMPEHIKNAAGFISSELYQRGIEGLYAVLNNAGGGFIAPIELMDVQKFRTELEARIVGPVDLIQRLLPMIRTAHGRILWIATPSIIPVPYVSSIHACDFTANCIARTLHIELDKWKIPNILIRCGGIDTTSPAKSNMELAESMKNWEEQGMNLYNEALEKNQESLKEFDKKRTSSEEVAKTVFKALCTPKPRTRYQIGYMSGLAAVLECLPQPLADRILQKRG